MNVNLKISIKSLISLNPNRLFYSRGRRPKYITTSFDNLIISITKKISNYPLPLLIERESCEQRGFRLEKIHFDHCCS